MNVTIPCACPPKGDEPRHPDGDTVTFRDVLDYERAMTITNSIKLIEEPDDELRAAMVLARMSKFYILMGIESWTLRDANNKPVPVNSATISQYVFSKPDISAELTETGESLYQQAILIPLLRRAATSSEPSPTTRSTSAKPNGSPRKSRAPSKRSSISTIPTAATEATSSSLDGVSNSSLSSDTAA